MDHRSTCCALCARVRAWVWGSGGRYPDGVAPYYTCIAVPFDLPPPAHLVEDARVARWTRVKNVAMDSIIEFGGMHTLLSELLPQKGVPGACYASLKLLPTGITAPRAVRADLPLVVQRLGPISVLFFFTFFFSSGTPPRRGPDAPPGVRAGAGGVVRRQPGCSEAGARPGVDPQPRRPHPRGVARPGRAANPAKL